MNMKKFMNKITNMFDDYSNPNQKLPQHNTTGNNQKQQQQPYQQQQQYHGNQVPPSRQAPPPPYGSNINHLSPQPGVYNSPQYCYPPPPPPVAQQYTNYNSNYSYNQQGLSLPPPPLSPPPIINNTHHYNNHHHHHYYDSNNNNQHLQQHQQNGSPNFNRKLSPTITGATRSNSLLPTNSTTNSSTIINPIPGAYGDGIHDDSIAVSNYFNQFPNSQIKIPPGNYLITQPIFISKGNTQLLGSPNVKFTCNFKIWNSPPLSQGFINTAEYVFVLTGDNIVLDSLNISCTTTGIVLSSSVIYLKGNGFIMRNCIIDNFNQGIAFGILNDCSGKIPPGSHFTNIKITQNQITNIMGTPGGSICYGDGIAFFGCSNVLISNNYISAKDGFTPRNGVNSGPEGFLPSTNVQFLNNTVRGDWDYAMTTEGGNQCILSNNDILGTCIVGIIERGNDIKVTNNTVHITGRECTGQTESTAIQFYGVDNGTIANNSIMGSAKYGILVKPSHESGGGSNTTIENNTIDGDFYNCIFFSNATQGKIHGNVVLGKSQIDSCVGLQLWYSDGLDIQGNNIDLPSGTACICSGTKNVNVLSNTMMTSRAGFYVCQGSDEVCIQNNDLIGVTQTKFDQSNDNSSVSTSQNYGLDYHPPTNNNNNSDQQQKK